MEYITLLLVTLSIIGASFALTDFFSDYFQKEFKPFTCQICLSFWFGLLTALATGNMYYIFIPYLLSKFITKWLWN